MVCLGNSQFPNIPALISNIFKDIFLAVFRNFYFKWKLPTFLIVYAICLCPFALEIKLRSSFMISIDGSYNLNSLCRNIAVYKLSNSTINYLPFHFENYEVNKGL